MFHECLKMSLPFGSNSLQLLINGLYLEFWKNIISFFCSFQENETTLAGRNKKSDDAREMQNFYQYYYKKYIQALQSDADKHDGLVFWENWCLVDYCLHNWL